MRKSFDLSVKVNGRFSQLHQAINEIRETKSQIESLHKRFADNERLKPALASADEMVKKMSAVEEKLIQVSMKSSEGNLVYPNMLNEEFYTFSRAIEADAAPTQPQMEVFKILDGRLEEQLKAWTQIKNEDVPKINALIKEADIPALTVASAAAPKPAPMPAAAALQCPRPLPPRCPRSNHERGRAEARLPEEARRQPLIAGKLEIRSKIEKHGIEKGVTKQPAFDRFRVSRGQEFVSEFDIRIFPVRR